MRTFNSGATRDDSDQKYDYEGFLHPYVIKRFGEYMHKHRKQSDGNLRDSDNWQKGIPKNAYIKSMYRHFVDVWSEHRGIKTEEGQEEALTALMFNVMGYLFEILKEKKNAPLEETNIVDGKKNKAIGTEEKFLDEDKTKFDK